MNGQGFALAQSAQAEREKQWEKEYRSFEARRDFRRARLHGFLRSIARGLGLMKPAPYGAVSPGQPALLPIDSIVGVVDEQNGRRRALRVSGRGSRQLWQRSFCREAGVYPALKVTHGETGWHLVGAKAAVVQLEVLRVKGLHFVEVAVRPEDALPCITEGHLRRECAGRPCMVKPGLPS